MGKLIDADKFRSELDNHYPFTKDEQSKHGMADIAKSTVLLVLNAMPPVDAVPVRCKDCKHRPTGTNRDDLEFPDNKCPCQCDDFWYSWKPSDDWFCGNGEQKDSDGNG